MVRYAEKSDIADIAKLESEYIECAWTEKMLLDAYADNSYIFMVYEENAEIFGYISAKIILDEAEICNIAVDVKGRNKGVATLLLQKLFTHSKQKGVKKIFLEVNENNGAAISLYGKTGFTKIAERKNYYNNSQTAFIFAKSL